MNSCFRAQFVSSIQLCSETFWFMFFSAAFATWFLQYILVSFFGIILDLTNVLTTIFGRFKRHICLSDLILMLKEYICLELFNAFVFPLLVLLLVIFSFWFVFKKSSLFLCCCFYQFHICINIGMPLQVHCCNTNWSYFM